MSLLLNRDATFVDDNMNDMERGGLIIVDAKVFIKHHPLGTVGIERERHVCISTARLSMNYRLLYRNYDVMTTSDKGFDEDGAPRTEIDLSPH